MAKRKKMSRKRRRNRAIFRNIVLTLIVILSLVLIWHFAIPTAQKGMTLLGQLNQVGTEQSSAEESSDSGDGSSTDNSTIGSDNTQGTTADTLQAEGIDESSETTENSSTDKENLNSLAAEESTQSQTDQNVTASDDDWALLLVNKDNPIPDNYEITFTELSNGQKVDSRIYPDLQAMFDAARASGLQLYVREGYRTQEEQQQIMDDRIRQYENEGSTAEEAKKKAEEYVAIPGTSEHQLGLSVDINPENKSQESKDKVYGWLAANAYKYGFIKRYPSDKVDITGISNEPWHYRYVGKEAADEMQEKGLCLEEYLEQR